MIIKNAKIFYNNKLVVKDILIKDKKIIKIKNKINEKDQEIYDAKQNYVLPGAIDLHAHLREPGQMYKGGIKNSTLCALKGGVTTVYDMPNTKIPTTTKKRYLQKKKLLEKKSKINFGIHYGITQKNYKKIFLNKPKSIKIYLAKTTGNLLFNYSFLEEIIYLAKKNKTLLFFHCEDTKLLKKYENQKIHSKKRPLICEIECIKKVTKLLKKYNYFAYFCHLTSLESIKIVKDENKKNICECTPAHLILNTLDEKKINAYYKKGFANVNPPLRNKKQQETLLENMDKIDVIGSDNAPHTLEEKSKGFSGFCQIEFLMPILFSLYLDKKISIKKLIEITSLNQAKLINEKKGRIKKGYDANLCIIKPKEIKIDKNFKLKSKFKWTPFINKTIKAKVIKTMVNGKFKNIT